MKIAIVHEYLCKLGGAERVLKSVCEIFPHADIYCLVDKGTAKDLKIKNNVISATRKFPKFLLKKHQFLAPIYPLLIENIDLSDYEIVISLSNSFSHGVVTNQDCLHVNYYHSPMRFIWDYKNEYPNEIGLNKLTRFFWSFISVHLRKWDFIAAQKSDINLCISKIVQKRIQKYFKRSAKIISPPVQTDDFNCQNDKGYFLIVSRLSRYKNIELAVKSFNKISDKLIIAGTGEQENELRKIANSNIKFLGRVSDEKRIDLFNNCKGFLFLNEEDFGITPIEAMASGKPVLAYRKGGLLETIEENKNGLFFDDLNTESFLQRFKDFKDFIKSRFEPQINIKKAANYSENHFKRKFLKSIKDAYLEKTGIEFKL